MPSVEVRLLILAVLVFLVIAHRKGWLSRFKEQRQKSEADQAKQQRQEQLKERLRQARERQDQAKQQTLELLRRSVPHLQQKSVEVAGSTVHYLEGGARPGAPTVMLLHGFASEKEVWGDFATHLLARPCHVVAPDLPGFGLNEKNAGAAYDVASQAKWLRAFARRLGIERLHLVGCSIGATIAAAYACGVPDEVLSLTLIEPFGLRVPYETELDKLLAQDRNPLVIANPAAYDNLLGFLYAKPPVIPPLLKKYRAELAAENRLLYLKIWKETREGERAHLLDVVLPEIRHKTLFLVGAESKVVHPASVEVVKTVMHDVWAATLEGCGHFPMAERPRETAERFLELLDAVEPAAAAAAPAAARG